MSDTSVTVNRLSRKMQTYARMQYILAGALVVSLALFYLAVQRPQQEEMQQLTAEIAAKQMELVTDRSQTDRLPRVAGELAELKRRLAGFKQLPPDPQQGNFIHDIDQLSSRSSLADWSAVPGAVSINDLYTEQPIVLSFDADFRSAVSFIRQVEDMQRLTRVTEVNITSTDSSHTGRVRATVSVNIYYSGANDRQQ